MKRQRCQPDASEECGDGAKAAHPQARKRPAPFCPPLIRAVPAAATSCAAGATGAPTAAAAAATAPAAKAVPTPRPSPISAPLNLRRPSPKRTTSSASLPSPSVPAAQPAAGRAPSVPGLRRQLGPPTLARAQTSAATALQPAEATRGGSSHCPARKTPAPRPRTTGAAPMPSVSRAAAKPPRESDVAAAAVAVEAQGPQGPTHMAGSVSGAAKSYDDAGGARIAGVAAVKELDTVQSDQSPSGSTEPRGAAGSNSDHAAGDSPEREQHVGTDAAAGALAGDGATPQPATASRRQSVADEEAPAERRVMSTRTPAPTPTPTPPAGTSSNAAGVSANTGETVAATAAHGPSLSPSPAPALLRAAESQLRRERASAPAPAVPADPSPLPPQRASPCVSGRRSGVTPSTSATTEQEQRRLAEQLPRLLSPMLALDEVAQPQWVSPLPPLLQPSQPQQQRQEDEDEDEAQEDEQDEEQEAPATMPSRQPGRGEAAPAAPGAAAATQSGAAGAGRSSNGAAAAEEVAISRLPVKELVPLEPLQLPESASGSSPFSQLMRVLPLSRLLAPLPPGTPPQLRVASAAAARGVQGALRPRKALAVHTPPQAQPSTSNSQLANDPTVAEVAGAAVRSLLLQGGGTGSRAGAASGGGGGAGGSDVGRGQHLRQAMRLARILAAARGSTLRAFRPPPAPPRPIQAAVPDSSGDDASGGQVSAAGDGEEDACEAARPDPDPEALAACAPGGSVPADGAGAGEDTIRRRRPSGEMEGVQRQSKPEPMASEAWPLEALELQPPSQSDAALRPQRDRGALAAAGDGGVGMQGSGAERDAPNCVSAAAAGGGAVEMESCADSPPSGDGVIDESRQRPGGEAMPAAAEQGGVGGGGACREQHTAWSGLSLAFLADVFNT